MEIYLNDNEQGFLREILNIDIKEVLLRLSRIEDIFALEEYSDAIYSIIKESNMDEYHSIILDKISSYIEKNNYSEIHLNSFKYYYARQKEDLEVLSRSRNNKKKAFETYKNHLLNWECSFLNIFSDVIMKHDHPINKKIVAVFESCQANMHPMGMLLEAKMIRDALLKSNTYYPFVTLSTNKRIFKLVLEELLPELLHFVCHGEENGDLVFFNGNYTGVKCLSPEYLEKLMDIYGKKKIDFIYLNSCYSKKFVEKTIVNDCSKNIVYHLGYDGENNDSQAIYFSRKFYTELSVSNSSINDTFTDVYNKFPSVLVKCDGIEIDYKEHLFFA